MTATRPIFLNDDHIIFAVGKTLRNRWMQEPFSQVRLWNAVRLTVSRETLKWIRKGRSLCSCGAAQRHPPASRNLAHTFVTVPAWTRPYFVCKCDTIYYDHGGLRLFTVYLPLGGATVLVVTSLVGANAQSKRQNRAIRDDKSLYSNDRERILQRMLMRKRERINKTS